jgi:hypothetical protein
MKKIFYVMAAAALACGCAEDAPDESAALGGIYGVITDKATGEPIRSAGVHLNPTGINTVTGSEGQYEFVELKAGDYTINVTKTGYTDLASYKITVAAGKTNKGDVQLEKLPPSLRVVNDSKQNIDVLDFGGAADDVTRSFSIFNDGTESLEWQVTTTSAWITKVSKAEGVLKAGATQAIIITIDRDRLAGGENTTTVHITSDNGSKQLTVKATENRALPTLNTLAATDIAVSTAILHGAITNPGIPAYTERGFVYSTSSMPTVETTIAKLTASITENSDYTATAIGLTLGSTYYVRAYAINKTGTAYSTNEVSFTTAMVLPTVTTQEATNINATIATFNGTIVIIGDPVYIERGFVYGSTHNPTVDDDTKKIVSGSGEGAFSANITELTEGTTYYVRAYATNSKGTAYGSEISLVPAPPSYVELSSANIAVQKTDISSGEINWTTAKSLCENSNLSGYTDWRLPTLDELTAMYNSRTVIGGFKQGSVNTVYDDYYDRYVHDYYDYDYWTSTPDSYSSYYLLDMTKGATLSRSADNKSNIYNNYDGDHYWSYFHYYNYARCVRTLP